MTKDDRTSIPQEPYDFSVFLDPRSFQSFAEVSTIQRTEVARR